VFKLFIIQIMTSNSSRLSDIQYIPNHIYILDFEAQVQNLYCVAQ